MDIKLIEDPRVCLAWNAGMTGVGLHDQQCSSCGMQCSPEDHQTTRFDEQMRLLLSRDAVLRAIGHSERESTQW